MHFREGRGREGGRELPPSKMVEEVPVLLAKEAGMLAGSGNGRERGAGAEGRRARRQQPVAATQLERSGQAGAAHAKPRILALYAREMLDSINVHWEQQELAILQRTHSDVEFEFNAQPTFHILQGSLINASGRNVKIVHVSGHGKASKGLYLLKDNRGSDSEPVSKQLMTGLIASASVAKGGTVECVVLNACETEQIGQEEARWLPPSCVSSSRSSQSSSSSSSSSGSGTSRSRFTAEK